MNIVIRFAIWLSLCGTMAFGIWLAFRHWERVGWKSMVAWCLLRLAALAVLVFYFDRSLDYDIEGWVMHGGWMAAGHCPGIDFRSPYAWGFNLVLKWCAQLGGGQFPLAAYFAVVDFMSMALLFAVVRDVWDEKTAKRCLILYFTSPVYLTVSCLWIQDEPVCLFGVALLLWFATRRNAWAGCLGMALAAGTAYFFTKTLTVFYLAPFLLLRGWKGAGAAVVALAAYVAGVHLCGLPPFDLVFGRTLGLGPDVGEHVLDITFSGNVWSILPRKLPHVVTGTVCFLSLAAAGLGFLPDMSRSDTDIRERMGVALELVWIWFFAFNLLYTMTIVTYVLPMAPFLLLLLMLESRRRREFALVGAGVLTAWYMLRVFDVYVVSPWRGTELGGVLVLVDRLLLVFLAVFGLWIGIARSRGRFDWILRRFAGEEKGEGVHA